MGRSESSRPYWRKGGGMGKSSDSLTETWRPGTVEVVEMVELEEGLGEGRVSA